MKRTLNTMEQTRNVRAGIGVWVGLLTGCLSLAPEEEHAQVARILSERAGAAVNWRGGTREWDSANPLTVDTAVRLALHRHPRIRQLLEEITRARADFVQAYLLPNPVITLLYGFPQDGLGGAPASTAAIQQLAALWEMPARTRAANADLRRKILEVSDRALRRVTEVRNAYARLAHAESTVDHDQELIDRRQSVRDLVARRLQEGEATQEDLNTRELSLLAARDQLLQSQELLGIRKRELLELVGASREDADLLRTAGPASSSEARLPDLDEATVILCTVDQRLDVNAAYAAIEGTDARTQLAAFKRFPRVEAGAGLQRNFENRDGVFPTLRVTPGLFDTGRAAQAKAHAIDRGTRAAADALLHEAVREARVAWIGTRAARDRKRQWDAETLKIYRRNRELAQQAFEAGTVDRRVVIDAEGAEIAARRRGDELTLAVELWANELERAVGGYVPPPERRVVERHAP